MSQVVATKGKRQKLKALVGIAAPSGAGKTLSALILAYGLMKKAYPDATEEEIWDKIGVLDTEHRRALFYAEDDRCGIHIGEFWHVPVDAPFSVERYIEAINQLRAKKCEVIIIDSATHVWAKEGGILELHDQFTKASASKNSYLAWGETKPVENLLSDAFFYNDVHMIITMRSKQEYVMEMTALGKNQITKLGMKPIQRDDMEYEFMTMFNMNMEHAVTVSKDNTGLFDGKSFVIKASHGEMLYDWLEIGVDVRGEQKAAAEKALKDRTDKIALINLLAESHPSAAAKLSELQTLAKAELIRFPDVLLGRALGMLQMIITEAKALEGQKQPKADEAKEAIGDKLKAGAGKDVDKKSKAAVELEKAQAAHAEKQRLAAEAEVKEATEQVASTNDETLTDQEAAEENKTEEVTK